MSENNENDEKMARELVEAYERIKEQVHQVIVGQDAVLEQLLIAMLARGHCLLEGVPGLAKTLMIRSLAQAIDLGFRRIQFTPDLMPADITGTDIIQEDKQSGHRELILRAPWLAKYSADRNQPDPTQNSSRVAPGHAGTLRHHWW